MVFYLYSRMGKLMHYYESMLVIVCRIEILGIDTEHTGKLILSYFPDMEIFDFTFPVSLYLCSDFLYDRIICGSIYENSRSISQEKIRPTKDKDGPKYSHSRIEPVESIVFCS